LAWSGVHLALLTGMDSRSSAMVDWSWELFTHKRGKRAVIDDED
ncbi:MAG: NAD(P)/FAD-dependent oxidoreductase, partial [Anaerolineae bacterium]|nr:NAD(P)/FAD-dependent oxidoreductase [Anaerolineae bacterium]